MKWPVKVDWESPAGKILTLLGKAIPPERRTPIILFGSAALQVTVAPTVLSEDTDIAPDIIPCDPRSSQFPNAYDRAGLTNLVNKHQMGAEQKRRQALYIQVNSPDVFAPGTGFLRRVMTVDRGGLHITIPHPLDILIAKLHRYEHKDLEAFQRVYANTGFPSPEIVLAELRANPRLFIIRDRSLDHMPSQFPASKIHENVPKLFRDMWKMNVSVKRDILATPTKEINESYNDHKTTHLAELEAVADEPSTETRSKKVKSARSRFKEVSRKSTYPKKR